MSRFTTFRQALSSYGCGNYGNSLRNESKRVGSKPGVLFRRTERDNRTVCRMLAIIRTVVGPLFGVTCQTAYFSVPFRGLRGFLRVLAVQARMRKQEFIRDWPLSEWPRTRTGLAARAR